MKKYFPGFVIRAGVIGAGILLIAGTSFTIIQVPLSTRVVLSCLYFLIVLLVYSGTGVLAARWGKKVNVSCTISQSATQGAFAGGLAGTIVEIISRTTGFITNPVIGGVGLFDAVPAGFIVDVFGPRGIGLALSLVVRCIGMVLDIMIAIFLASINALIYAAVSRQQNKPAVV